MGNDAADRFQFRIDDVFTVASRGIIVAGLIERGSVRAGDRLQLIRGDGTEGPVVACRSVEFVDRPGRRPGDQVTAGLIVPDLSGHDAAYGDMLVGKAPQSPDERYQPDSCPRSASGAGEQGAVVM